MMVLLSVQTRTAKPNTFDDSQNYTLYQMLKKESVLAEAASSKQMLPRWSDYSDLIREERWEKSPDQLLISTEVKKICLLIALTWHVTGIKKKKILKKKKQKTQKKKQKCSWNGGANGCKGLNECFNVCGYASCQNRKLNMYKRKAIKVNNFFASVVQSQDLGGAGVIALNATGNVSEPEKHPGIAACGWSQLIWDHVTLHVWLVKRRVHHRGEWHNLHFKPACLALAKRCHPLRNSARVPSLRRTGPLLTQCGRQPQRSSNLKQKKKRTFLVSVSTTSSVGVGGDLFLSAGGEKNISRQPKALSEALGMRQWQRTEHVSHLRCHGPAASELPDTPQESLFMSAAVQYLQKEKEGRRGGRGGDGGGSGKQHFPLAHALALSC